MQSSASLDRYIQQVRAIPKLSREEEHELALQVVAGDQAAADKLVEGDLAFNLDFRSVYTEILEDWLEVDAKPIVKGTYEKVGCFN